MSKEIIKDDKYWFVRTTDEVLSELNTNKGGLSSAQAQRRLEEFGENTLAEEDKWRLLKVFFDKFNSLLIYVLFGSAIISLLSDHVLEFVVIIFIIFFTVILGFIQEYGAGKAVEALKDLTGTDVEVIRDGQRKNISTKELVPGDIIFLERGMLLPADVRILESKGLMFDESILTGESVQKRKVTSRIEDHETPVSDRRNMGFSGTSVTKGSGTGVVVSTGFDSEIGKISATLKDIGNEKTPLQRKVDGMSERISYSVIFVSLIFFFIMFLREFELGAALLLVGAVIVSGIPESFPLALTIGLSSGVRKMAEKNAIIKDLGSVETLGTTTIICTDKTGTLTENKMNVKRIVLDSQSEFFVDGRGYEPIGTVKNDEKTYQKQDLEKSKRFFEACILCNNAVTSLNDGEWVLSGEPTEGALLTVAKKVGYDDVVIREEAPRIHEIPFDPAEKYMVTVNHLEKENQDVAFLKGAVEVVFEKCQKFRDKNGNIKSFDEKEITKLKKTVTRYSSKGLRVLAVASKEIKQTLNINEEGELEPNQKKLLEEDYVFEGFLGIQDPIRKDVYKAVRDCKDAGIRIIMVTGDHKNTAQSIGEELGLVTKEYDLVIEGKELEKMDDEELSKKIDRTSIFARTTPEHKYRIVKVLREKNEVVAMTGDGVNDAPALKKADIGIAMGKDGTEVARQASNLVLADDNFKSIVEAVRQGRTIYSNIRRFIFYLLTVNFSEVGLIVLAVLIGLASPLTALMVLFINVITSVFPALALSVEPTHEKVMSHKPRNPNERLLSKYILLKILVFVPIVLFGTFSLYLSELRFGTGEVVVATTIAFATIIVFELFHTFNARSLHTTIFNERFFKNKYIFLSIAVSTALMLLAVQTPFGNYILDTVPLDWMTWTTIVFIGSTILIVSEVIKLLVKSEFEEQRKLTGKSEIKLD